MNTQRFSKLDEITPDSSVEEVHGFTLPIKKIKEKKIKKSVKIKAKQKNEDETKLFEIGG